MATPSRDEDRSSHGVTIGLREIYDQVVHVAAQLTHLAQLVATIESRQHDANTEADDLEERVRHLEQKPVVTPAAMWTALGVLVGAAGVIATIFIALIGK